MTMQREPVRRKLGRRVVAFTRTLVALAAVGVAGPLMASGAAHPVRTRPRLIARPAVVVTAGHARAAGRGGSAVGAKAAPIRPAKGSAKHAGSKSVVEAKGRRGAAKTLVATKQSRHFGERPVPIEMRRVKAVRGHVTALRATPMKPAAANAPVRVAKAAKPLTVDDFVRAASAADAPVAGGEKTYVRGESRTEEDDRVVGQLAPVMAARAVARRPVSVAKVEAGAADPGAVPLEEADAEAPIFSGVATDGPSVSAVEKKMVVPAGSVAKLAPLTRQEVTEEVLRPVLLPGLYRNGRLVVPAPLKGTHEILVHQNTMADDEGLERIEDEDDLRRMRASHLLVDFPETVSLHVNPDLAANRRCGRVWSVRFAGDIGRAFYARFKQPLQVNSAVRTVAYQVRLQKTNGNAAGVDGEAASPHLTGQALDLGKRGMSMAQIAWMRAYLLPLMQAGKVDVEEEFQQACFHISVYRSYLPAVVKKKAAPRVEVAQAGKVVGSRL